MTSDWKDTSGVIAESEPPALTDAEVLGQLRVLLVDDDLPRGRSFLACTRELGVDARLATHDGRGLVDASSMDPEVVLVLGQARSGDGDLTALLGRHPRLRWASVVEAADEPDFPTPLDDDFGPRLAAVVRSHVSADRRLERLARTRRQFAARIDSIGPSRTLRALSRSEGCLRLTVSSPQALSEIDLSDGLIAGATWIELIDGTPRELVGPTALSALLELDAGLVFVERRARPELLDIMVPADEALASATVGLGADAATSPDALELPDADAGAAIAPPRPAPAPGDDAAATDAAATDAAADDMAATAGPTAVPPADAAPRDEPITGGDTFEMDTMSRHAAARRTGWSPFDEPPDTGVVEATSVEPDDDDTPTIRPAPGEGPDDLFDESLRSAALRAPSIPPADSLAPPPLEAGAGVDADVLPADALDRDSADLVGAVENVDEPRTVQTGATERIAQGETATTAKVPSVRSFATQKAFPPPGAPPGGGEPRAEALPEPFARRPASTLEAFRFPQQATETAVPDRGNDPRREPGDPTGLGTGTAGYDVDREAAASTARREARASDPHATTSPGEIPSVQETMRLIPEGARGADERPTRPEKPSAIPTPRLRRGDIPGEAAPPAVTPTAIGPLQDDAGGPRGLAAEPPTAGPVGSVAPARYVPTDPPVVVSGAPADGDTVRTEPATAATTPDASAAGGRNGRPDAPHTPTPVDANGTGPTRAPGPPRLLWAAAAVAALGLLAGGTALWRMRAEQPIAATTEAVTPARDGTAAAAPAAARAVGTGQQDLAAHEATPAGAPEPAATEPSDVGGDAPGDTLAADAPDDGPATGDAEGQALDDGAATAEAAAGSATTTPEPVAPAPSAPTVARADAADTGAAPVAEDPERDQARSDMLVGEARDLLLDGAVPARVQALLDEALAFDDRNPRAEEVYAELLLGQGRAPEAEAHARRAVELRRRRAAYRILLGDTLWAQGKHEEARREYGAARELDPDDPVAAQRLRR